MATRSVNDQYLEEEEKARLLNLDNREAYEASVRAQAMGHNDANFSDRDIMLYGNPHRSQTANL